MILILKCGSNKTPHIEQITDEFMDYRSIDILDFKLDDLDGIKGVIISGAPLLVTEIDLSPYLAKVQWIKETKIPVLGICFGHQLIGILHGAFASMMKEDRDWQDILILEEHMLFNKLPNEIQMMEDHCETVSIPPGFILIASSDACVNEAMIHKDFPIYGVQFHPEVSGNHGRVIIQNFIESLDAQ